MKRIVYLLLLLPGFMFSQNIQEIIAQTKQNLAASNDINEQAQLSADLAWYYVQVSTDTAEMYGLQALELAKKAKNTKLIAQAYNDLGTVSMVQGDYEESIKYCKDALKLRKQLGDEEGMASIYFKMGNNFNKLNDFDSTMHYYFEALEFYEKKGDSSVVANLESNIAACYFHMKNYDKALNYLKVPIQYFQNAEEFVGLSNSLSLLGNVQLALKDTTLALSSYKKAEEFAKQVNNNTVLAAIYNNYAVIYSEREDFDKAIFYIQESIAIRESLGQYSDLESSRLSLAINLFKMGDYESAKPQFIRLKDEFEKIQAKEKLKEIYLSLSYIYAFTGNTDSVQFYNQKYQNLLELLIKESTLKSSQEIEVKYQTEKKEKEILEQRASLAEQRFYILLFVALFIISVILGYLFWKQQKISNEQLAKENQLKDALLKIETQNKLQEQRLRISRDLHDNIGAQLTFVISSIDNLKFLLKSENQIVEQKLSQISNFTRETIHELRDTIWAMNMNEISLEDLKSRIANFIEQAKLSLKGIQFDFIYTGSQTKNLQLSSHQGMNLYRIIQEAVNNAIKHAQANKILVEIEMKEKVLEVKISDNGKGFDIEEIEQGNGIHSMKKRANELNANIEFNKLEQGSQISIHYPLT